MEYSAHSTSSASLNQPIGLQKLAALDNIVVYATRTWSGSKYKVTESSGEHLFDVREEPRSFFSWNWAFTMALVDVNGVEVISVHRKNRFGLCKLEISIQGSLVSLVHQKWSCLKPLFEILDANEIPAYRLEGPWNRSYQFKLTTMDKATIGGFSRGWAGFLNELRTNGDSLNISFPQPLDTKYKAACIAASIHIIDARRRRQHVYNTSVSDDFRLIALLKQASREGQHDEAFYCKCVVFSCS